MTDSFSSPVPGKRVLPSSGNAASAFGPTPSSTADTAAGAEPTAWIASASEETFSPRIDSSNAWMVTFTDLVALMLAFFVLLYAMSHVREPEWQNLISSLRDDLEAVSLARIFVPKTDRAIKPVNTVPGQSLDYLTFLLTDQMAKHPQLTEATIARQDDRLIISLPSDLLFTPGSASPGVTGQAAIFSLGTLLGRVGNRVEIAGHADPIPPVASYPSNWELSLARAAAVSDILTRSGYAGQIVARGHGDTHYRFISQHLPEADRKALARRVDVIVHKNSAERQE